jgi:hypothetical protein
VQARAGIGAAVSFADLLSDAFVVKTYLDAGQKGDAVALMAMVGVNLLSQLAMVMLQNKGLKKDKWRTIMLESLAVVTFTKPGMERVRRERETGANSRAKRVPLSAFRAPLMHPQLTYPSFQASTRTTSQAAQT